MRKRDLEILVKRLQNDLDYLEKRFNGGNYQTSFGYLENHYVKRNEYEGLKRILERELDIHKTFIDGLVEMFEASGLASTCNQCGQKLPTKKDCC